MRGTDGIDVVDTDEIGSGDLFQESRVMESERASADYAHANVTRCALHTITPRCDASMKRRNDSTSGTCGSSTRARATPWLTVKSELKTSR